MYSLKDSIQEKLDRYHLEADLARQVPKGRWRKHTAELLRSIAAKLEPELPPKGGTDSQVVC